MGPCSFENAVGPDAVQNQVFPGKNAVVVAAQGVADENRQRVASGQALADIGMTGVGIETGDVVALARSTYSAGAGIGAIAGPGTSAGHRVVAGKIPCWRLLAARQCGAAQSDDARCQHCYHSHASSFAILDRLHAIAGRSSRAFHDRVFHGNVTRGEVLAIHWEKMEAFAKPLGLSLE